VTARTQLATARETLKARFDEQQQALADYYGLEHKAQRLRDELSKLEARMRVALGRLARTTDAATAARLTGTPLKHTRAAAGQDPAITGQRTADGAGPTAPNHLEVQ
jgi:hypothetical protein